MQKISATVVMEIPEDKVIITKAEYNQLKLEVDSGYWWTTKDVEKRYNRQMRWLKENVLYKPEYEKILSTKNGGCVHYPDDSGVRWSFEPVGFKQFMKEHFSEINN